MLRGRMHQPPTRDLPRIPSHSGAAMRFAEPRATPSALASLCAPSAPSLAPPSGLTLCDPAHCSPPGSSVLGESPGKHTGVGYHTLLQGTLPNPGAEPRSPALQADSFPTESPGKTRNSGVGGRSLLRGIFLTKQPNQGLLHASRFFTSGAPGRSYMFYTYYRS